MTITTLAIAMIAMTTPATNAPTRHVGYRPAELATVTGRAAVRRRIGWAAETLCEPMRRAGSVLVSPQARACRTAAIASATRQLDIAVAAVIADEQFASR